MLGKKKSHPFGWDFLGWLGSGLVGSLSVEGSVVVEPLVGGDLYATLPKLLGNLPNSDIIPVGFIVTATSCSCDFAVGEDLNKIRGRLDGEDGI